MLCVILLSLYLDVTRAAVDPVIKTDYSSSTSTPLANWVGIVQS